LPEDHPLAQRHSLPRGANALITWTHASNRHLAIFNCLRILLRSVTIVFTRFQIFVYAKLASNALYDRMTIQEGIYQHLGQWVDEKEHPWAKGHFLDDPAFCYARYEDGTIWK